MAEIELERSDYEMMRIRGATSATMLSMCMVGEGREGTKTPPCKLKQKNRAKNKAARAARKRGR